MTGSGGRKQDQARQNRLAEALRDNLKRRKAQARSRREVAPDEVSPDRPDTPVTPDRDTNQGRGADPGENDKPA
jgi:hypothetical protein